MNGFGLPTQGFTAVIQCAVTTFYDNYLAWEFLGSSVGEKISSPPDDSENISSHLTANNLIACLKFFNGFFISRPKTSWSHLHTCLSSPWLHFLKVPLFLPLQPLLPGCSALSSSQEISGRAGAPEPLVAVQDEPCKPLRLSFFSCEMQNMCQSTSRVTSEHLALGSEQAQGQVKCVIMTRLIYQHCS